MTLSFVTAFYTSFDANLKINILNKLFLVIFIILPFLPQLEHNILSLIILQKQHPIYFQDKNLNFAVEARRCIQI